eukprot:7971408-Pyramimonas_sp.AAC.1
MLALSERSASLSSGGTGSAASKSCQERHSASRLPPRSRNTRRCSSGRLPSLISLLPGFCVRKACSNSFR